MPDTPSIRSLAAGLNLSRATVSEALRGSPRVKEETRRRVVDEAERMGYRLDPVASELMGQMRRSVSNTFRGVIALVVPENDSHGASAARLRRAVLQRSAEHRAMEFGFKLDPVAVSGEKWSRLQGVLHARGVIGALLLPSEECCPEHRARLAEAEFQTVYCDAPEEGAEHVDAVAPDYRQALLLAQNRLTALGYRRPGLLLCGAAEAVSDRRWRAAWGMSRHSGSAPEADAPPPFVLESRLSPALALERWRREHGVDIALAPGLPPPGYDGPVCSLDLAASPASSLGVDLRWDEVGARAVELLARGYFDRMRGRRCSPALLSLPARWQGSDAARLTATSSLAETRPFARGVFREQEVDASLIRVAV
jgi:LacI family transcriptional regulator